MKKNVFFLMATAMLFATACGNGKNGESQDSTDQQEAVTINTNVVLTKEGVGPVKIGMLVNEVPASVEEFYDSVYVDEILSPSDRKMYRLFFYMNGEEVWQAFSNEGKKENAVIERMNSPENASTVKIMYNNKLYGLGDNVEELINNNVITETETSMDYFYDGVAIGTYEFNNGWNDTKTILSMSVPYDL